MNWLPLLNPPLRIRPTSIGQEPKLCSINSRHGRLRKMLKRCLGPNGRSKMSEQLLCNPRHYQSVGRSRPRTPLGHRIRRRKMPSRSCNASVFAIDLARGRNPASCFIARAVGDPPAAFAGSAGGQWGQDAIRHWRYTATAVEC